MDTTELRATFRLEVDDVELPYLWSEGEVTGYMDAANKMFARLTGGIRDVTSDLCLVDIEVGEAFASVDHRILEIARIQRNSDGKKLDILNVSDVDDRGIRLDNRAGAVTAVVVGMQANTLRWLLVPIANDTVTMIVDRLPLATITGTRAQPLEIDEKHHRYLTLWMKALAYAKQDSDTSDQLKMARNDAAFRDYCAQTKIEKVRAQHKNRTVRYGGL